MSNEQAWALAGKIAIGVFVFIAFLAFCALFVR